MARSALHAAGHRFCLQASDLPGRPDIVFRGDRVSIFVHGCFWHRHEGCPHCRTPKSRLDFWLSKFAANVDRGCLATESLIAAGWSVEILWECEARDPTSRSAFVDRITCLRERSRK
jgi:DNA mismatch endonuclease (patch repair protein)